MVARRGSAMKWRLNSDAIGYGLEPRSGYHFLLFALVRVEESAWGMAMIGFSWQTLGVVLCFCTLDCGVR